MNRFPYLEVPLANNLDLDGTQVYAVVARSATHKLLYIRIHVPVDICSSRATNVGMPT